MSNIAHDYIEEYIRNLIPDREGFIGEMEHYADEFHVPIVEPEVAQFLKILIKTKGIKNILEVGAAIGYSSLVMAQAAGEDCRIVTIERDDSMFELASSNIKKAGCENNIKIVKGDALEVLKCFSNDPQDNELKEQFADISGRKFDLVFIDAAKGHYEHFLPYCLNALNINGLIVADNVLFRGMVATNKLLVRRKITIVKRMRKYLDTISKMPELETVVLPISDGIALSVKTREV